MKQKIMCISIFFLMLMIPITAIGQTIQTSTEDKSQSETMEKNAEVIESESINSAISVSGGLWIRVVIDNREIIKEEDIEEGYKYKVELKFDDGPRIIPEGCEGFIKGWGKTRAHSSFIFGYRLDGYISGQQGKAEVKVRILKPLGGSMYLPVLEENFEGTIIGPFASFN